MSIRPLATIEKERFIRSQLAVWAFSIEDRNHRKGGVGKTAGVIAGNALCGGRQRVSVDADLINLASALGS
jgi:hypothetical protein